MKVRLVYGAMVAYLLILQDAFIFVLKTETQCSVLLIFIFQKTSITVVKTIFLKKIVTKKVIYFAFVAFYKWGVLVRNDLNAVILEYILLLIFNLKYCYYYFL